MKTINHFTLLLLCTLLFVAATFAQSTAQDVTIIIQQEQVRFTSQKAVQVMQLQIVNQSGERVIVMDGGVEIALLLHHDFGAAR